MSNIHYTELAMFPEVTVAMEFQNAVYLHIVFYQICLPVYTELISKERLSVTNRLLLSFSLVIGLFVYIRGLFARLYLVSISRELFSRFCSTYSDLVCM